MKEASKYEQYVYLAFLGLVITLPFSKGLASVAMVLLLASCIKSYTNIKKALRTKPVIAIFSILILLYIPGLLSSEDFRLGLTFLYKQIGYLIIPIIILSHLNLLKKNWNQILYYFILSCGVASILTLILFLLPEEWVIRIANKFSALKPYEQTVNRVSFGLYSPFIDRLHFSYLLVLSFLFSAWLTIKNHSQPHLILLIASIIAFTLLGGRGAQLGGLIVLPIWIIIFYNIHRVTKGKNKVKSLTVTLIILGSLILLPIIAYHVVPPVQKRYDQLFWELKLIKNGEYKQWNYEHFTSLRRLLSLKHHAALIKSSPWLGVGVGDYRIDLQNAYNSDEQIGLNLSANANNQYLFYWANAGIFALLLFIFVCYYWSKASLKNVTSDADKALIISFISFFAFILVFDVFIVYQIGIMAFCFFGSLISIVTDNSTDINS